MSINLQKISHFLWDLPPEISAAIYAQEPIETALWFLKRRNGIVIFKSCSECTPFQEISLVWCIIHTQKEGRLPYSDHLWLPISHVEENGEFEFLWENPTDEKQWWLLLFDLSQNNVTKQDIVLKYQPQIITTLEALNNKLSYLKVKYITILIL